MKHLLPLLTLLALMLAPFGRVGMAEAAMPAHDVSAQDLVPEQDLAAAKSPAMSSHCADMPAPAEHEPADLAIDCMIACAVMTPSAAPALPVVAPVLATPESAAPSAVVGITTESEPPPPRHS